MFLAPFRRNNLIINFLSFVNSSHLVTLRSSDFNRFALLCFAFGRFWFPSSSHARVRKKEDDDDDSFSSRKQLRWDDNDDARRRRSTREKESIKE